MNAQALYHPDHERTTRRKFSCVSVKFCLSRPHTLSGLSEADHRTAENDGAITCWRSGQHGKWGKMARPGLRFTHSPDGIGRLPRASQKDSSGILTPADGTGRTTRIELSAIYVRGSVDERNLRNVVTSRQPIDSSPLCSNWRVFQTYT